jgi:hypothetical protein
MDAGIHRKSVRSGRFPPYVVDLGISVVITH